MSLTLGLTGMDPATEAALKSAFEEANARLQGRWQLAPEADADHVVVDMDSMYGPMSWLRLHAAGKHVIGLTSAARTQTDFRLGRPFDSHEVARLLEDVARHDGVSLSPVAAIASSASAAVVAPTAPAGGSHGGSVLGATAPPDVDREAAGPRSLDVLDSTATTLPHPGQPVVPDSTGQTPGAGTSMSTLHPEVPAQAAAAPARIEDAQATDDASTGAPGGPPAASLADPPPRETTFADWLLPGALSRRVRYRRESGPTLLIDPTAQAWHGPTPLKPMAAYFEGHVRAEDFEALDDATWGREQAAAGPAQSLVRLRWLGGLVAGRGRLLPGLDPEGRYVLNKWPQTEREYPKHFRIATAMMKGPSRLTEIAAASGLAQSEVADFVNANLATGFAEFVPEPPPQAEEPPRPTGLLGRLRNR